VASTAESLPSVRRARDLSVLAPSAFTVLTFALLFAQPMLLLVKDWWSDPEAGHGLLLAPLAVWLGWRVGVRPDVQPAPGPGILIVVAGVALRWLSGMAAELFTMRLSMVLTAAGLIVCWLGFRQLLAWWLPITLFTLSIPIPDVLTGAIALPLQFRASAMGAALLEFRHVPVILAGNVIHLPGRDLFVTEACSGLRSLTALLSLGVLAGGLWLRYPISRVILVLAAIPVAMLVNAFRVFLTGFLVYYVSPQMGDGFMHLSEGWLLFLFAFVILGGITWITSSVERQMAWKGSR
jgi:exosortase